MSICFMVQLGWTYSHKYKTLSLSQKKKCCVKNEHISKGNIIVYIHVYCKKLRKGDIYRVMLYV